MQDYYTQTAFEFVARGASGGQLGTVLAGGRYDGLVAAMGGKDLAGVGWAAGVDRLIALATASGGLTSSAAPEAPFVMVRVRAYAARSTGGRYRGAMAGDSCCDGDRGGSGCRCSVPSCGEGV